MPFGPLEIGIVLLIVLVIFGPKRLPDLGRSLGSSMKEFKDSVTGGDNEGDKLTASEKKEPVSAEKKEPVHAEKSDQPPAGGQSS